MTFAELVQECQDSGLDHLSDTRAGRFVNLAYKRIYNRELWPWRLTETTGVAPVTIAGTIRQVLTSDGYSIPPANEENIENNGNQLSYAGAAQVWYHDKDRKVRTFPVDGDTLTIRYYAKATDLSGVLAPDLPDDYHYLVVLDAVRMGKLENGEVEAAREYAANFAELFADLKRDSFNEHVAGPYILNTLSEGS